MGYVSSNIAREISRLYGWRDKVWSRRYQAIVISDEEEAQVARLKYLLAHGCKEGLVARPQDWPGAHAAHALVQGKDPTGLWFDRTQEYAARRRGEDFSRLRYATREILTLDPLPCWKGLTEEQRQRRAEALVDDIEAEATIRRKKNGIKPLGPAAILTQDPHRQPARSKKSPAPAFHAASQAVRRGLREAYALFLAAYREAAEKLRMGDRNACFPAGSFPPGLPFVGG